MNDDQEKHWMQGNRAAWRLIFNDSLRHLGMNDPIAQAAAYLDERNETIAYLRGVCAEYGDNDWPNDLHLMDIIEKHLLPGAIGGES